MNILYIVKSLSIVEPLGIMQMSAITKSCGHKSFLGVLDNGNILDVIDERNIDLIGFSFLSPEARAFFKASHQIRNHSPNVKIIAGGPHPTFFPQIIDSWPIDGVVVGEGDYVMGQIVEKFSKDEDISNIANVHTKMHKNDLSSLVEDLDELPYVDRDLVHHVNPLNNVPMKSFMATRGCPYNCTYCFNNAYKKLYRNLGKIRRQRSVENLIREIEDVEKRYPMKFLRFGDDVFVTKYDDWLEEFVYKYKTRISIPFYFLIYPHLVTNEVISALKDAGCHSVSISIETGNEDLRKRIIKRPISDEIIINAYSILRNNDIKVFSNCMLGLPKSTIEDDIKSLELTFKCAPTYASFTVYTPFPGTDLYQFCKTQGYINTSFEDEEYPSSTFQRSCLNIFSDRDKDIHENILTMGALANWRPSLRKLITNYLIYWKPNKIFRFIGFLVRNYLQRKIWPIKSGLKGFFKLVYKVYKIDKMNYKSK